MENLKNILKMVKFNSKANILMEKEKEKLKNILKMAKLNLKENI